MAVVGSYIRWAWCWQLYHLLYLRDAWLETVLSQLSHDDLLVSRWHWTEDRYGKSTPSNPTTSTAGINALHCTSTTTFHSTMIFSPGILFSFLIFQFISCFTELIFVMSFARKSATFYLEMNYTFSSRCYLTELTSLTICVLDITIDN